MAVCFLIKYFFSCFKCSFFFFVVVCVYQRSGGEVEDYIKCELIVGGSPRYLNTFSNLFNCCLCSTHI